MATLTRKSDKKKKRKRKEKERKKKKDHKSKKKKKRKRHDGDDSFDGKKRKRKESNAASTPRPQLVPMTREAWEKKQSVVRRVLDKETGRVRLVKGDGEIIEEIVSRSRHRGINRTSTLGDGESYKTGLLAAMRRKQRVTGE